jgi:hypothetical protein
VRRGRLSPVMRRLLRPLWIFIAAVFLLEAWLWSHLAPAVSWIVDRLALPALKARLAGWVGRLPARAAVVVFLVPMLLVLPMKLLGVWLLSRGSWVLALALLVTAKVVSVGLTAFIFQITKPKLLQLAWFRWVHARVVAVLAWAHGQIDPVKARLRAALASYTRRVRAHLARGDGRLWRRILRLRRRAHRI